MISPQISNTLAHTRKSDNLLLCEVSVLSPELRHSSSCVTESSVNTTFDSLEKSEMPSNCRICYDGTSNTLISPCRCKGTVGLLHKSCLERWLQVSQTISCEICGYKYKIRQKSPIPIDEEDKISPRRSISVEINQHNFLGEWLHSRSTKRRIFTDCIFLTLLTPVTCFGVYFCISTSLHFFNTEGSGSWQFAVLLSISIILLLVFLLWFGLAIQYHIRAYLAVRRRVEDSIRESFYRQSLERSWRFSVHPSSFSRPKISTPLIAPKPPLCVLNGDSEISVISQ
nr:E3 ubiquitin protein ligase MARCH3 [Hymenolepis microstoma]